MIFGGKRGFFADKTAKVILLDENRRETVLHRTIDNWKKPRPPGVDDRKLQPRARLVAELKERFPDRNFNIVEMPGPPDSVFGSGMLYVAYYLEHGLVVGVDMRFPLNDITLRHPGE